MEGPEKPPNSELSIEQIDSEIESLLEVLSTYEKMIFGWEEEWRDELYWVEMEAKVGIDRATAREKLRNFIKKVEETAKGKEI